MVKNWITNISEFLPKNRNCKKNSLILYMKVVCLFCKLFASGGKFSVNYPPILRQWRKFSANSPPVTDNDRKIVRQVVFPLLWTMLRDLWKTSITVLANLPLTKMKISSAYPWAKMPPEVFSSDNKSSITSDHKRHERFPPWGVPFFTHIRTNFPLWVA